ncbi:TIGR02611 family protein [Cryptosporangium minutisporangium]|uniref:TIGR02611 family protein n=1 Tax=Cryptosporangium minutisporangium TaxID=113569 RepID=A0ABP6SRM6_9ACTN
MIDSQERPADTEDDAGKRPTAVDRLREHRVTRQLVALGVFFRDRLHHPVRSHPVFGLPYRVVITVVGVAIVLLGLVLVPAPGPGWLIVIAGLGVLSTEFSWAHRLLQFTKRSVAAWTRWVLRQPLALRMLVGVLGFLLLVAGLLTSLRLSGWTGFPFS